MAAGEQAGVRLLAALAPAAMLAVDPWGWYPFGPVKWLVVSTLVLLGSALVLRTRPLRLPDPTAGAIVFLLGWMALAALAGEDELYAWIGTPERRFGVLTWGLCALLLVIGRCLDVRRDGPTIVNGLLVAGLGVGAVATAEALGFEPDVLDVADRLTGTFGSSAYLGAASALLLPIACGVALGRGAARRRQAATVAVVLLTVAFLGSGARAAWFGLAVAAAVTVVASYAELVGLIQANRSRAGLIAAGALVLVVGVLVLSPVAGRIEDATDSGNAGGRGRVDEWQAGTDVLRSHLLLGVGPEGYRIAFHEAADLHYAVVHGREVQPDRAHNGPLDVALAGGFPALLAWTVLVTYTARSAWSALRHGPGWLRGVAAALVAHGVGQLFFFPVVELEPVAWLLAGVLLAARPRGASRVIHRSRRRVRPLPTPLVVLLLVGATAALVGGVTEVIADHEADRAVDALARGDGRAAVAAADAAADLRPDVVRLHLLAARASVAGEEGFREAIDHVDDALAVSPGDPIALLTRATYVVDRAEATGTRAHLVEAVRAVEQRVVDDPWNAQVWALFTRVAELAGDEDAAAQARRNVEVLDGGDRDQRGAG